MRLVIDLQACQSEVSAGRGVGRYAESLALHIADGIVDDDLRLCFNKAGEDSLGKAIARFERRPRRQQLSAYRYAELAPSGATPSTSVTNS